MKKIMFTVRMGNPLEDDFMVSLDTFFPMELTEEEWELSTNMRALAELSVVPYNIDQVCKANSNYIKRGAPTIRGEANPSRTCRVERSYRRAQGDLARITDQAAAVACIR